MIILKSQQEMYTMQKAGLLAWELLELVEKNIKPGISTEFLNQLVHEETVRRGAKSAPLGYKGFPKAICTSVNEVICHGIPSENHILKEGDIINVDVTPILEGYHGDTSRTFYVGDSIPDNARRVTECARQSLDIGISVIRDGIRTGDIGYAIQTFVEAQGFSVVRDFVAHGTGKIFHEDPQYPHFGRPGTGVQLMKGMVFTVEPMVNEGTYHSQILEDGWTAVTADGKLSAQFEHTVGIGYDGKVIIFTLPYWLRK